MIMERWKHLRQDTGGMEEIGFLYVFSLSVLFLWAILVTVTETTQTQKESTTITFFEDVTHHVTSVVQDVIDMHISNPDVNYSRYMKLRHSNHAYQYRIEISETQVTAISRTGDIRSSRSLYNPDNIIINEKIQSDSSAIMIQYDPALHEINISVVWVP